MFFDFKKHLIHRILLKIHSIILAEIAYYYYWLYERLGFLTARSIYRFTSLIGLLSIRL